MYKLGTEEKKKKNGRYRLFMLGFNPIPLESTSPLWNLFSRFGICISDPLGKGTK